MNYPFSSLDNFKTAYPAINKNTSWAALETYMKQTVSSFVLKFIDRETYNLIYSNSSDAVVLNVRNILNTCIANATIYEAMPHINAVISDLGVRETQSENSLPISQWRFKNLQWNCLSKSEKFLDMAIEHITSNPTIFTEFKNIGTEFFKTSKTFFDIIQLSGFRAFVSMLPYIKEAESELNIKMCDFYTDITSFIPTIDDAGKEKEKMLINLCRVYIAEYAMSNAIPRLLLYLDSDGIKITSSNDGFDFKNNILSSFGKDGPQKLIDHLNIDHKKAIDKINNFLFKNRTYIPFANWYAQLPKAPEGGSFVRTPSDGIGAIGIF